MTEKQFKRKLIIRITASAFLLATGAFLLFYFSARHGISQQMAYDFKGKYTLTIIGALVGAGLAITAKLLIILFNPNELKKAVYL